MKTIVRSVALFTTFAATSSFAAEWEVASKSDKLTIWKRDVDGSEVQEIRAEAVLKAPAFACQNVVDDIEHYTEFMPNTHTAKVLSRKGSVVVTYQRISAPIISDRDYSLRKVDSTIEKDGATIYRQDWTSSNDAGPAPVDGVVRVNKVKGYWQFEPTGPSTTKATYYLHTDPGGSLPAWVVNMANDKVIPKLMSAVETQAQKPKYQTRPESTVTEPAKEQEAEPASTIAPTNVDDAQPGVAP